MDRDRAHAAWYSATIESTESLSFSLNDPCVSHAGSMASPAKVFANQLTSTAARCATTRSGLSPVAVITWLATSVDSPRTLCSTTVRYQSRNPVSMTLSSTLTPSWSENSSVTRPNLARGLAVSLQPSRTANCRASMARTGRYSVTHPKIYGGAQPRSLWSAVSDRGMLRHPGSSKRRRVTVINSARSVSSSRLATSGCTMAPPMAAAAIAPRT